MNSMTAGALNPVGSPTVAEDLASTTGTVRVELEAGEVDWEIAPGLTVKGWGFNGQVPGPTLEAKVGDTVIIRLTNRLPEPTLIHWHGLRVPAAMDGTDAVQRPVPPGETFEYRFVVPDAGTFWYHSHANETVQMERGLYGAFVVRGDDEPHLDAEKVLILDDLRLAGEHLAGPGGPLEVYNGREGPVRLISGRASPQLSMAAGQVERWRIVNASSARYVRLAIGGTEFHILGTDGGLLPAPVKAREVLLTPGERVELAVGPFAEGSTLALESLPYDRGTGRAQRETLGTLRVLEPKDSGARIPPRLRPIEPLVKAGPIAASREVHLGEQVTPEGVQFLIDGHPHRNADPVRVGELQVWDIVNDTPLDHPFHLHGFFFQVLERNGETEALLSWEDTVNVPARDRVRIAWLPDDRPGTWMFHCHILEHHAAGMMANFEVVGRDGPMHRPASPTHHHHHHH